MRSYPGLIQETGNKDYILFSYGDFFHNEDSAEFESWILFHDLLHGLTPVETIEKTFFRSGRKYDSLGEWLATSFF